MVSPSAIRNITRGKRIRCRFQSVHAHVEQESPEFCRVGNRTTVVPANGEVLTQEEATVYVKVLDWFVTVKPRRYTGSSLTRKTLRISRFYYHWTIGQKPQLIKKKKPQLIKNGRRTECNTANCVPTVVPGLPTSSSSSATLTPPTSIPQEQ